MLRTAGLRRRFAGCPARKGHSRSLESVRVVFFAALRVRGEFWSSALAAILRRFLTYGGLERWVDPLGPATVEQPPGALLETYRFFLKPVKWLIVVTLIVSLVASVTELAMFSFLGSLVDRMSTSTPDRFIPENAW